VHTKLHLISVFTSVGLAFSSTTTVFAAESNLQSADKRLKAWIVSFSDLSNWPNDHHEKALATFRRSCGKMRTASQSRLRPGFMGRYKDWSGVCSRAKKISVGKRELARKFFEKHFIPAQIISGQSKSLFTGYFEPELKASLRRSKSYSVPLYRKPKDLKRGDKTYFTRAQIESGALKNRGLEFVYLKSPVDAFFLHIQGSGRLFLENGKTLRVGFAAKNGRPYTAIGKVLIDRDEIARKDITMQSIRKWLTRNKHKAAEVMQQNQSFIFFRPLKNTNPLLGPPGAQGIALTPRRSLAVDKTLHGYGQPLWLETDIPDLKTGKLKPFHHLMIAQDTGSAIKGAVRGDIFWGSGTVAGKVAGKLKQPGKLYILLPKHLAKTYLH